ncbi:hypothetical protein M0R04_01465 [Candidatus Dojkabacteria bacterium]|jgi:CxxC-x17-CxxC domain-containing protein|nr:hypothetical protein [Candidatus Dojkabacteria bacterium]
MREFKRSSSNRRGGDSFNKRSSNRGMDRPEMTDAVCADCGKSCRVPFRPTGGKPVYCSDCFEKRGNGADRNDDRRGGDRYNRDDRGRSDREMFPAVCDECGKDCQLPFKPSNDKPIYCSDCFEKKGNVRGNSSKSDNTELKDLLEGIDIKLIKILSYLEPKPKVVRVTKEKAEKVAKKKVVKKEKVEVVKPEILE